MATTSGKPASATLSKTTMTARRPSSREVGDGSCPWTHCCPWGSHRLSPYCKLRPPLRLRGRCPRDSFAPTTSIAASYDVPSRFAATVAASQRVVVPTAGAGVDCTTSSSVLAPRPPLRPRMPSLAAPAPIAGDWPYVQALKRTRAHTRSSKSAGTEPVSVVRPMAGCLEDDRQAFFFASTQEPRRVTQWVPLLKPMAAFSPCQDYDARLHGALRKSANFACIFRTARLKA